MAQCSLPLSHRLMELSMLYGSSRMVVAGCTFWCGAPIVAASRMSNAMAGMACPAVECSKGDSQRCFVVECLRGLR